MTLREVNSKIFDTECGSLLIDGLSYSQPILSIGSKGLIDNFFIYSQNRVSGSISAPKIAFGIYSDLSEVAYINYAPGYDIKEYENTLAGCGSTLFALYEKYERLYSLVRTFVFKPCNPEQSKIVMEYCEILKKISGADVWLFYNELFPDFFDWAEKITNAM